MTITTHLKAAALLKQSRKPIRRLVKKLLIIIQQDWERTVALGREICMIKERNTDVG